MTQTLRVNGMTCNGCVSSVTNAIKRVAGVRDVNVSLEDKQAKVDFDERETSIDRIEEAVREAGYEPAGVAE